MVSEDKALCSYTTMCCFVRWSCMRSLGRRCCRLQYLCQILLAERFVGASQAGRHTLFCGLAREKMTKHDTRHVRTFIAGIVNASEGEFAHLTNLSTDVGNIHLHVLITSGFERRGALELDCCTYRFSTQPCEVLAFPAIYGRLILDLQLLE